jgi:protein CpxP
MKRIFLSMLALSLTFGSFAQAQNKDEKKDKGQKEWRQKANHDRLEKLNLNDAQKSQMKTLNESFRSKLQALKQDKSLSEDSQKQKRSDLMKEHRSQVQSILTPEQKKQWEESMKDVGTRKGKGERTGDDRRIGQRGNGAARFEKMSKDLNLTDDQSARLKKSNESFKSSVESIRNNSSLTDDQKKEQVKNLHKKRQEDINSILTDEQKAKFKSEFKGRKGRGSDKITK